MRTSIFPQDTSSPIFYTIHAHRFVDIKSDYIYTAPKVVSDFHSLFYITEGEHIITINDVTYLATPNHFIFVPKGVSYSSRIPSSKKLASYKLLFNFSVNNTDFAEAFDLNSDNDCVIKATRPNDILHAFDDAVENYNALQISLGLLNYSAASTIVSNYVIDKMLKNNTQKQELHSPFYEVTKYMNENMYKGIKISDLANIVYMESTYFIRKFKNHYGVAPLQYFDTLRLNKAIDLILNTDLEIADIAESVGINDISYFNRFFRKHGYASPSEYRYALEQHEITKYIPPKEKKL